jgi:L-2-hydroxyglutarate oxidase LhgO
VHWQNTLDYSFDPNCNAEFMTAILDYYPNLDPDRLVPGYTGIRPKIVGPGEGAADFSISTHREHGIRGLVNLYGMESPGLTSCLAIAEAVCKVLHD